MNNWRLLFSGQIVGAILNLVHDGPEVWATFEPTENARPLIEFWKFITNEANYETDPPFPPEYMDDELWQVEDARGTRRPIFLPAVYEDGAISWRWRD